MGFNKCRKMIISLNEPINANYPILTLMKHVRINSKN